MTDERQWEASDYLSVQQLAQKLNVSAKSVIKWYQTHRLPFVKIGRLIRFSRVDIEKRLNSGILLDKR